MYIRIFICITLLGCKSLYAAKDIVTGKEKPTTVTGTLACAPTPLSSEQKQGKEKFDSFVDISFTKSAIASKERQQQRLTDLNTIAVNLLIRANDRASELLPVYPVYEKVENRLHEVRQKDTSQTMQASKYAESEFLRKIDCDTQLMYGYSQGIQQNPRAPAVQRKPLSEAQLKQYLEEEFEVLNKQYTKVRESIKTLTKKVGESGQIIKDTLPDKISADSLIKFGQGR